MNKSYAYLNFPSMAFGAMVGFSLWASTDKLLWLLMTPVIAAATGWIGGRIWKKEV